LGSASPSTSGGDIVGSHPDLRSPLTALSLNGLRRRIEAELMDDTVVVLRLDRVARLERDRRRSQAQHAAR
jgi:hypothetical protein